MLDCCEMVIHICSNLTSFIGYLMLILHLLVKKIFHPKFYQSIYPAINELIVIFTLILSY